MHLFHCEYAWLGGDRAVADVELAVTGGVITSVTAGVAARPAATRLPGLTLPGLANTHSHVFHRAIRGHTQSGAADFWQWRELMYQVANRLGPDSLYELARATYVEMALAGITSVGEFFYLHHGPGGRRYADPNELGHAVLRAAADAGIRITLLDTVYLQAGVGGEALGGAQQRFSDGDWERWAERVSALVDTPKARIGAAIHSVRAVPRAALGPVAEYARSRGMPLHVHVSEQPAENEASLAVHGMTPVAVLADARVLGPATTAVHATHLTGDDVRLLSASRTAISLCPTTERDLADGIGPAAALAAAGSPLCVGSDGHMMIDLLEEGRAVELDNRLATGVRGYFSAPDIARMVTTAGQASIGWDAGGLASGAPADFVTVDVESVRTAGARSGDVLAHALFSASAADVTDVVVAGEPVVTGRRHVRSAEPGRDLAKAIAAVLG